MNTEQLTSFLKSRGLPPPRFICQLSDDKWFALINNVKPSEEPFGICLELESKIINADYVLKLYPILDGWTSSTNFNALEAAALYRQLDRAKLDSLVLICDNLFAMKVGNEKCVCWAKGTIDTPHLYVYVSKTKQLVKEDVIWDRKTSIQAMIQTLQQDRGELNVYRDKIWERLRIRQNLAARGDRLIQEELIEQEILCFEKNLFEINFYQALSQKQVDQLALGLKKSLVSTRIRNV